MQGRGILRLSVVILVLFCTCVDPFTPGLRGYESLMVVDARITDREPGCTVILSRSVGTQDGKPVMINDATVSVSDDEGGSQQLVSLGNGKYEPAMTGYHGNAGRTYTLHITTPDGKEYESDPELLLPSAAIDSVYFERYTELGTNGNPGREGIMIYAVPEGAEAGSNFRWDFTETWKFKVPEPKAWDYINEYNQVPHFPINEFCWKDHESDNIIISRAWSRSAEGKKGIPVIFIPSEESDRLLIQYSILVRQQTISDKEYGFWDDILEISNAGNDIFGRQPWTVTGNIHCLTAKNEKVLGYFQTAGVSEKRLFISVRDIVPLALPYYHYGCPRIAKSPSDFKYPITFDEIYAMYCVTSDYAFVEPWKDVSGINLYKLIFTRPECADCTLTGTKKKPDFWVDLDIKAPGKSD
jgi:hypothetical protein